MSSFESASNIFHTLSKPWSEVLDPACLPLIQWTYRDTLCCCTFFWLGRHFFWNLWGPLKHRFLLSVFAMLSINENSLGVKLLNAGICCLEWPTFHWTQQSYMPPFGNWKSFGSLLMSPWGFVWSKKVSCVWVCGVFIHCLVGLLLPAANHSKVSAKLCNFSSKHSTRFSENYCPNFRVPVSALSHFGP
jgi:hypothetical protein